MKTRPLRLVALGFIACLIAARLAAAAHVVVEAPQPFPPSTEPVTEDANNQLPKLTNKVDVAYPAELAGQGVRDRVFVAFVVDTKGQVHRARAAFGTQPACEAAAVAAVQQWTFTPGRHDGRPAWTQMTVEFRFEPDGAEPAR